MYNELFHIGPFTIYTYGLMIAIGILAAYYVAEKRGQKLGMDISVLDGLTLWILIGGFAGAKILYWITRIQDIPSDPSILTNIGDGWVVYGGILGGLAAGWIYCRQKHASFWEYFDLVIPSVALAQGFGRLGCFFAGCCYGMETEGWWAVTFPEGSLALSGVGLLPTQLISSAYDFLMFFVLLSLSKKTKFDGQLGGWYLILYSAGRFVIEFFRGDLVRGGIGMLSTSQIISIFAFLAGIFIVFFFKKREGKKEEAR